MTKIKESAAKERLLIIKKKMSKSHWSQVRMIFGDILNEPESKMLEALYLFEWIFIDKPDLNYN